MYHWLRGKRRAQAAIRGFLPVRSLYLSPSTAKTTHTHKYTLKPHSVVMSSQLQAVLSYYVCTHVRGRGSGKQKNSSYKQPAIEERLRRKSKVGGDDATGITTGQGSPNKGGWKYGNRLENSQKCKLQTEGELRRESKDPRKTKAKDIKGVNSKADAQGVSSGCEMSFQDRQPARARQPCF